MELARRGRLIGTEDALQNNQCRVLLLRSLVASIHRSSCQICVTPKVMRKRLAHYHIAVSSKDCQERESVVGGEWERRKGGWGWGWGEMS